MSNIGIVGYGRVGGAIAYGFGETHNILAYDKYPKPGENLSSLEDVVNSSEFIFVSLPTPYKEKRSIWNLFRKTYDTDLSIMDKNVKQIRNMTDGTDKIVIIKSTVVPGTTREYSKKYPETNFCMNPEFLTDKDYLNDFLNADRIVIGADREDISLRVTQLYRERFPDTPIIGVNLTEAEMIKYMANCFLSTKVIFGNEIRTFCEKLGIDYGKVKDGVIADKRIGKTHLDAPGPDGDFGFGGKCFAKDIMALIALGKTRGIDVSLLESVWHKNLRIRKNRDWEDIPWVKSE